MSKSTSIDPETLYRPKIFIELDAIAAAKKVAALMIESVSERPSITLGLATGGTPVPVYDEIVKRHQAGQISFSKATSFNLDEYVGLGDSHPQSFRYFMDEHLFDHVDFRASQIHVPDGLATDAAAHAEAYDRSIGEHGGIDWQLLGIGHNGHIAFNEPGSPLDSRTRVVSLTDETIDANSRFFDDPKQVPRTAISMGIGTILEARQIVLLATGESKADAIASAIDGPADVACPASLLQHHRSVVFVLDQAAATGLSRSSEYRPVHSK